MARHKPLMAKRSGRGPVGGGVQLGMGASCGGWQLGAGGYYILFHEFQQPGDKRLHTELAFRVFLCIGQAHSDSVLNFQVV